MPTTPNAPMPSPDMPESLQPAVVESDSGALRALRAQLAAQDVQLAAARATAERIGSERAFLVPREDLAEIEDAASSFTRVATAWRPNVLLMHRA